MNKAEKIIPTEWSRIYSHDRLEEGAYWLGIAHVKKVTGVLILKVETPCLLSELLAPSFETYIKPAQEQKRGQSKNLLNEQAERFQAWLCY